MRTNTVFAIMACATLWCACQKGIEPVAPEQEQEQEVVLPGPLLLLIRKALFVP